MKKYEMNLLVSDLVHLPSGLVGITLTQHDGTGMPEMEPGQFVEVCVDRAKVLLNRPISIFDRNEAAIRLLVAPVGRATKVLAAYRPGETIKVIGPLGHGFTCDFPDDARILLVGGGVGIAPLYYLARKLKESGHTPEVILGSRTAPDKDIVKEFERISTVHVCTDDGSEGFHGLVTQHPAWDRQFNFVQVCGPKPMMQACARKIKDKGVHGEASLENMMACGLGACLCCVEKTTGGNLCVCKDGPVFNIDKLW